RLLLSALDYEAALPAIGELLVPNWAAGCAIVLFDGPWGRVVARSGVGDVENVSRRSGPERSLVSTEDGGWSIDAPSITRAQPLGVLRICGNGGSRPMLPALVDELALRIAAAVESAQAIAREHHVADTLQRALLPERLPRTNEVIFDASYLPGTSEA